jgi:hypothetical protein
MHPHRGPDLSRLKYRGFGEHLATMTNLLPTRASAPWPATKITSLCSSSYHYV